jgi:hypothetical protein
MDPPLLIAVGGLEAQSRCTSSGIALLALFTGGKNAVFYVIYQNFFV